MVLAVSSGLSLLSSEDGAASNWDEATTSDYTEGQREGTGYVGYDVDIETNYNFDTVTAIVADVTGYHYGRWLRISNAGNVDLKAAGGIQLALRDGAGNESYFYVGGLDTYAGGWAYFVVDLNRTPDANNGANAVITNAADLGVGFKLLAKSLDDNCHIDAGHYGTSGLIVTGTPDTGTYGANNAWQEVFDIVDAANYGLMARQSGSFVLKAPVTIGDNVGVLSTVFNDADHIIFFADLPVAADFYNIKVVGNGTGTTDVALGGFINKTEGGTNAELEFGTSITSFSLKDSTFLTSGSGIYYGGTITGNKLVQSGASTFLAGAIADGWTFDTSSAITLNTTAQLTNSLISKCSDAVSAYVVDLARITSNLFESSGSNHAAELSGVAGSYPWNNTTTGYDAGSAGDGVQVTGGSITGNETIHIAAATGTFIISVADGATTPSVSSAGAIVNVVAGQKTLTITGFIAGLSEINVRDGSVTLPGGYEDNASDPFTMSFDVYAIENFVKLQITTPGYDYINKEITLFDSDVNIDVTTEMVPDPSWVP